MNSEIKWIKSFVHNCIAHPAMMFLPEKIGNRFHDFTANWAYPDEKSSNS